MKVSCELDTETKEVKVTIDGTEVPALEFSLSHYVGNGCEDETYNSTYLSLTQGDMKNRYTHSVCFTDGKSPSYSESSSLTTYAKQIEKVVKNAIAGQLLQKHLNKN